MEIEWVELPEHVKFKHENKRGKYVELALALKDNPGKWTTFPPEAATNPSSASSLAQNVNRGKLAGFGAGKYEAIPDGATVYVRFKPPAEEAQQNGKGNGNGSDDDPPEPGDDEIDPREVREWARKNGWPSLSDRGRLSGDILEAYKARES